jgi:hypothetical protein
MAKVHNLRKRHRTSQRNSQWILRCTHRHKGPGRQGNESRVLLAYHKHRCESISSRMRSMSENGESTKPTFHASSPNSTIMALGKVGDGSSWTTTNSSRKLQIHSCRCGLFHEMGGSKTTREHQGTKNSEILLAKHNLQIWSSERTDC